MKISIEQIQNMKHAIGLQISKANRGKFKSYRNHFTTSKPDKEWDELVKEGYAVGFNFPQGVGDNPMIYHVSNEGFLALEQILGVKIEREG